MAAFNNPLFNRIIVPVSFVSTMIGGAIVLKEYKGGRKCPSDENMKGKVCVITGASSGIGKSTAQELSRRGATVVMACRHMGKCESTAKSIRKSTENSNVVCRFVDLASMDSIEHFARNLREEIDHIDVLVNNAGVMKPREPRTTLRTSDDFERQFGVNYLGHFLLTNLLLDKLTNGLNPGRIINVASDAYAKGEINLADIDKQNLEGNDEKLTQLYYQSKLAVMLFADSLARRYPKLQVWALNPGVSSTNIGRYSVAPYYAVGMILYKPFQWFAMKTPRQGAQTSIYLSVASDISGVSGSYFDDCTEVSTVSNLCNCEDADSLWEMSEAWTDVSNRRRRVTEEWKS